MFKLILICISLSVIYIYKTNITLITQYHILVLYKYILVLREINKQNLIIKRLSFALLYTRRVTKTNRVKNKNVSCFFQTMTQPCKRSERIDCVITGRDVTLPRIHCNFPSDRTWRLGHQVNVFLFSKAVFKYCESTNCLSSF